MSSPRKYPIGVQSFERMVTGNFYYADKTDLVYQLAQKHVCFLCRPRRFGKSLLVSTLKAYFEGRRELFEGLKMMAYETEWIKHPVFHIDFADGLFTESTQQCKNMIWNEVERFEKTYGKTSDSESLNLRIRAAVEQAHKETGQCVVFLVDEYDKPMLDNLNTPLEQEHRDVLKAFYSIFKSIDDHLRFVMLTGVTKFSQVSVFSGFNQAEDISMDEDFEDICGISEKELGALFEDSIAKLATKYKVKTEEMKEALKELYDGYHFSPRMTDIYNPFSLINAFTKNMLHDFWFASGTPTYLIKLLAGHNINIETLLAKRYDTTYFIDYRANTQDPLAMLYQSGYLTIKDYDLYDNTYLLDFPNTEVRRGIVPLLANDYLKPQDDSGVWILSISRMLREGRLDDLRDSFTAFLASIPYEANKDARALNFETHFQYTFYLILRMLNCYTTLIEKQNSHGRADIIIETPSIVYIFEFKLDGTAAEALQQVEDKGYAQPYLDSHRKLYKIGVNISSQTRTVSEWVVK